MHNEDASRERERVRRQREQVGQDVKPNTARFADARRVKGKTHQDPFLAQKHFFWERRPCAVSPFKKRSIATDPRDWEILWRGDASRAVTEVLRHDNKNKVWKTQEVVDMMKHSSRYGDTDEDVLKILIREVVAHGTFDDRKDRFSFRDDFEETMRIADIERAWSEKMNAVKAENVTQNGPARWRERNCLGWFWFERAEQRWLVDT